MRKRAALPAVAVAAVMLVATGCNTRPGAAAVVGGDTISTDRLQAVVADALVDPQANAKLGSDRASFTRSELSRLITDRVVARAAADHGITASESDVDRQLASFAQQAGGQKQLEQQATQGGVPKDQLRGFVRSYVLREKLADALVANLPVDPAKLTAAYQAQIDQLDQVHSAHILVKDQKTATSILAQVRANPSSFGALAAKYSIDTSNKAQGGDLGYQGRGAFVKPFSDAIFSAKPGSFVLAHTQYGWHVIHVIDHRTVTLAQATPQLKATILQPQRDAALKAALTKAAKELGVHVSPRYGTWDASQAQVVAPKDQLSRPASTTPSAAAPTS